VEWAKLLSGSHVAAIVDRYEKPDAGFFSLLTLPPRILKPEISAKVGQSVLLEGRWQDIQSSDRRPRSP
jgi:hypothetical protein